MQIFLLNIMSKPSQSILITYFCISTVVVIVVTVAVIVAVTVVEIVVSVVVI